MDGTVGTGGHSRAIGESLPEKGRLICLDRDPEAVDLTRKRLAFLREKVAVLKANFKDLDTVLGNLGIPGVQGVLLDLGMSSYQLERSGRGFSFNRDEPLDMRMDPEETVTAAELLNTLPARELEQILRKYGEERQCKFIANAVVRARNTNPVQTSMQLASLAESAYPPSRRHGPRHPATRTFQALRIAVNKELGNLEEFLRKIPSLMATGGRLVILSYHSLEDRLVKQAMVVWEKGCTCPPNFPRCVCGKAPLFKRLIKRGVKPAPREIASNPGARSAIMRAAERIGP